MKGQRVSRNMSGKAKGSEWLTLRINKAKGQWQKAWQGLIKGHTCCAKEPGHSLWW